MHVEGGEARAIERGRHLDLAVDALLAKDRDPRTHSRSNERRRDILGGLERQLHGHHGLGRVQQTIVFLVGRVRQVAHALHRVRGRRPCAVQIDPRFIEQHPVDRADADTVPGQQAFRRRMRASRLSAPHRATPWRRRFAPARPRRSLPRTAREWASHRCRRARSRGRSARRTPFPQASRTGRRRRCHDRRGALPSRRVCWTVANSAASRRGSMSGASVAQLPVDLRKRGPAEPALAAARIEEQQRGIADVEPQQRRERFRERRRLAQTRKRSATPAR